MTPRPHLLAGAVMAAALLLPAADAAAGPYDNDIRLEAGIYAPVDLPTNQGPMYTLEVRNRLTGHDGLYYGIAYYHETRSVQRLIGGTEFTLEADIKLLPINVGWYHFWDLKHVSVYAGGGLGLYEVKAFSGGYSLKAGVQIVDVDEFRLLSDDSRVGFQAFLGLDFFTASRIGLMTEIRFHNVEDDFGGTEFSTGAVFRF